MACFRVLLLSVFSLFILAHGSPIEQQLDQRGLSAVVCAIVTGIVKEVKGDAKVTSHCSSFLKIPTSTVTRTGVTTATAVSVTTVASVAEAELTITFPALTATTSTSTSTTTTTSTVSAGFTTVTAVQITARTVTTVASPLCPTPISTTVLKRDVDGYVSVDRAIWAEKRNLEARATKKSGLEIVKSLQSKVASTVCGCLSIPTPTTTTTSLSTATITVPSVVTAVVTNTITISAFSTATITDTETTVKIDTVFVTVPETTITVPAALPTTTTTSTSTTVSTCTFTVLSSPKFLARSAAKVHARSDAKGAKPVRFSNEGSAFRLDTEGHLFDEHDLVAVAGSSVDEAYAPVEFQTLGQARNESMLVCGSGEEYLECNVGERLSKLMVCLPRGEEYPAMFLAEENYDGDCFDEGFKVEVQEL
ncbi:hypothetical protein K458DRAFT_489378 [Lentithecium fluviatile CBS 122367]|uniref:Uncharacterized protein n=1 Tax=Lentithecium fluviatile CBS 122367 TaxID=1168545 RepID=A0A6G1ISJ5_9PLEO|nr:hypothetical protein K458DRAFT_489378 [Lentithecium fluviatile CBS 122367]